MLKDPVCGMSVNEKTVERSDYNGNTYYFCSKTCKVEFDKNPRKYLKKN